jgi:hypothetical protein
MYAGSSTDSLVTEKKTVAMTSPNKSTTARMVSTSASQPGIPHRVRRPGMGRAVMVITTASNIGLMIEAVSRIPNRITNILAMPTR